MKNTAELRDFLSTQMIKVADGKQQAKDAKAICNYAAQIYNTLNIEYKVEKLKRSVENQPIQSITFSK